MTLVTWWLEKHCPEASRSATTSRFNLYIINSPLSGLPLRAVTTPFLQEHFDKLKRAKTTATKQTLSPAAINLLRRELHAVFSRAIRAGRWMGQNPVSGVEKLPVAQKRFEILVGEEIEAVIAATPPYWRLIMAAAAYTGMRKGEIFGLRKADVNLRDGTILVTRSHDQDTTKGKHADLIPISEKLRPFIEQAMDESKCEFVFPTAEGTRHHPGTNMVKVLRSAMIGAGLVAGYDFSCRTCKSKGRPHVERHQDNTPRRCPTCGHRLWVTPVPRNIRFHDLRHTAATEMLRAGVQAHFVQRILRHREITTTLRIYYHPSVDDLRGPMNQIGSKKEQGS